MQFNETLMTCVKADLEKGLVPMLLGEPGIGKSSWLQKLADLMHTKCFTLACNQLADKADLTGARLVPITDEDGKTVSYAQKFYPHDVIHAAITYAEENPRETPILFMDELNRTTPDVTSEALSIPTLRSIGSVSLPSNLRVVIAGNDKGNITSLDEASISRFVLYHTTPDVKTFFDVNPDLNPFVKETLSKHPEYIFCKQLPKGSTNEDENASDDYIEDILDDGEGMLQITTPRTITAISDFLNNFDNQQLMSLLADTYVDANGEEMNALTEAVRGHIGDTLFTAELMATIAAGIMTVDNQSSTISVVKPSCYDDLKAQKTIAELDAFVDSMTPNEMSGCLLYALYEPQDNIHVIQILTQHTTAFEKNDGNTFLQLALNSKLDAQNVDAFMRGNSVIANKYAGVLETY